MIYFIKHTEFVKIGFTDNIKNRLSQLQVSCPVKICVIGLIQGNIDDEIRFHQMFKTEWCHGEWFKLTDEIQKYIESLDKELMWKYGFQENQNHPIGLLKKCRLEKRIRLHQLGELIGISKQGVMDMERREIQGNITIKTLHNALKSMGYDLQCRAVEKIAIADHANTSNTA
jgi:DNA-binding XRE family transcriptional regulator